MRQAQGGGAVAMALIAFACPNASAQRSTELMWSGYVGIWQYFYPFDPVPVCRDYPQEVEVMGAVYDWEGGFFYWFTCWDICDSASPGYGPVEWNLDGGVFDVNHWCVRRGIIEATWSTIGYKNISARLFINDFWNNNGWAETISYPLGLSFAMIGVYEMDEVQALTNPLSPLAPNNTGQIRARSNPPLRGVYITLTNERRTGLNSGGHVDSLHPAHPNTPRGTFDPVTVLTSGGPDYWGLSTYTASAVSSIYRIYGTVCNTTSYVDVTVQVPNLETLGEENYYVLVGAHPVEGCLNQNHGTVDDTHYLTSNAAIAMKLVAIEYAAAFPQSPVLRLNDCSLIWGGLFDYGAPCSSTGPATWAPPHSQHREGKNIDVGIPANAAGFVDIAEDDFFCDLHGDHYHLRFRY